MVMARLLSITLVLLVAPVSLAQPTVAGEFLEKKPTQVVAQDPPSTTRLDPAVATEVAPSSHATPAAQQQQELKESPVAPALTVTVSARSTQGAARPEQAFAAGLNAE